MRKRTRHSKKKQVIVESLVTDLKVGDSIAVKPGVKDPNDGFAIGGWQGRVTEIDASEPGQMIITFQWDSISLKKMPASAIRHCEEGGLDWASMMLYPKDVEKAEQRDRQADVDEMIEVLASEHRWDHLGKQGQRIHKVLIDIDEDDELEAFETWQEHLEARLKLPFEAEVSEFQERGPFQEGDQVTVIGFAGTEDRYGVLVNIQARGNSYVFPLCDLKAANQKSTNFTLTDDHAVWFANR